MSSNVAFRGALELAGMPVNVALYSRVRKQRNESFKSLAPSGSPAQQAWVDSGTGDLFDKAEMRKGIEVGKDTFIEMPPEALEVISSGTKTTVAKPMGFAPFDTISWDLAIDRFAVLPDSKAVGSEQSVNIVWNGLLSTGLTYLTVVSFRGGHDSILAVYATDTGLWGALLPFEDELYDIPAHSLKRSKQEAAAFAAALQNPELKANGVPYPDLVGDFKHSAFKSEYRKRRAQTIDAVINGSKLEQIDKPKPQPKAAPDLMAILQAAGAKAPHGEEIEVNTGGRPPKQREKATAFLTSYLANGPQKASKVTEDAKQQGISAKTLRRAASDLKLVKSNPEGGQNCTWELPKVAA